MVDEMARKKEIRQALAMGKTYAAVAHDLGISRQRVQQLISPQSESLGVGVCQNCGREATLQRHHGNYMAGRYKALCIPCHRTAHKKPKRATGKCPACSKEVYQGHKYCSPECRKASKMKKVCLVCTVCGIEFLRRRADVLGRYKYASQGRWENRTGNYFCSKQCQGKWLGENYGKGKQKLAKAIYFISTHFIL